MFQAAAEGCEHDDECRGDGRAAEHGRAIIAAAPGRGAVQSGAWLSAASDVVIKAEL